MFEYLVLVVADKKLTQFELDMKDWIGRSKLDQALDVLIGGYVMCVLIFGTYNFATFSLGGG